MNILTKNTSRDYLRNGKLNLQGASISSVSYGGGGGSITGNYLPASKNTDGTYVVDLSQVTFKGNVIATGEVAAYSGGTTTGGTTTGNVVIIDNLESTETTAALSANQGRILNEKIAALTEGESATTIADLLDTAIDNAQDNQILVYNGATGKWINKENNATSELANLTDVNIADIADKQILVYDATTSKWLNKTFDLESEDVKKHIEDTTIHITDEDRTNWNNKLDKAVWDKAFYFDESDNIRVKLNLIGEKEISAYGDGESSSTGAITIVDNLTSELKDAALSANQGRVLKSLIDNIDTSNLDLTNYYTKSETDKLLDEVEIDLSDYYNKSSVDELLDAKATASDLTTHTADTTKHITATERTNWNSAFTDKHTHSNKTVLDEITSDLVETWNNKLDKSVWDKAFYFDESDNIRVKVNLIGEKEVSAYGSGDSSSSGAVTIVDALTSTATDAALSANQGRVLKSLIDNIDTSNLDLTNYYTKSETDTLLDSVEVDLSDYYNKSETDELLKSKSDTTHTHTFASLTSKPTTLSGYGITDAAAKSHTHSYLPLSGGTLTGNLVIDHKISGGAYIQYKNGRVVANGGGWADNIISMQDAEGNAVARLGMFGGDDALTYLYIGHDSEYNGSNFRIYSDKVQFADNIILHSGNYSTYAPTLTAFNNHKNDTTIHITATERTNWNKAYNNNHTHTNKTVLDGITSTKVNNWDSVYSDWNDAFYYDTNGNLRVKVNLIGEKEVSAYGEGTSSSTGAITIVDNLTSTLTDAALSANQGRVLKSLIDNIDTSNLDLSNYYTKSETDTKLNAKAESSHTHTFASLTSKPTTLSGYGITDAAAKTHTHSISNITNLQTTLDGKSNTGHTHTFASLTSKPTTLSGYGITDAVPKWAYSFTNGCLVKTDIVAEKNSMVSFRIEGNSYTSSSRSILTVGQFYDYADTTTKMLSKGATNYGYSFGDIKAFIYNGYVYLWFKQGGTYQTFFVSVFCGSGKNRVVSITDAAMPTSGVTKSTTITPNTISLSGHTHTISNITNLQTTLDAKATASDLTTHTGNTTVHITSTERTNWNKAYTNNHTHSNKTVLDGITSTKVSNWDGVVSNWNKAFYFDSSNNLRVKLNLIGEGEVSAYGDGTSSSGGAITIVDALTSTATDAALSANQGRVLKALIDNIDTSNLDLSAYYTSAETDTLLSGYSKTSHSHTFASLTSKPTTLSGYGITDAAAKTHSHTMSQISDYGTYVYDATLSRTANYVLAAPNGSNGKASFRALVAADIPTLTISKISGLQTALDGKSATGHTHTFASLTNKPTTLSGYGITDAASSTHTHSYLPLSGGTMTGVLTLTDNSSYIASSTASAILGFGTNSTFKGALSTSGTLVGSNSYPTILRSSGNDLYHYHKTNNARYIVLDANNYTSYCATSGHTHTTVVGNYTANGGQQNPNYFGKNKVGWLMMNTTVNGNSHYKDWMIMDCYSGTDVGGAVAIGVNRQALGAYIMRSESARTSWAASAELIGTHNYTTYCAKASHSHTFASLTSKPTTLSGYGITDAASSSHTHYIGTTQVQSSSATQNLTGIGSINGALTITSVTDGTNVKGSGYNMFFGGSGYANQAYYFRPMYGANGATVTNVYIQNASAAASPTFTTTHSFTSSGNATHSGTLTTGGAITTGGNILPKSDANYTIGSYGNKFTWLDVNCISSGAVSNNLCLCGGTNSGIGVVIARSGSNTATGELCRFTDSGMVWASGVVGKIVTTGAELQLKYNNTNANSLVLNSASFKPFTAATDAIMLGRYDSRWKGLYVGVNTSGFNNANGVNFCNSSGYVTGRISHSSSHMGIFSNGTIYLRGGCTAASNNITLNSKGVSIDANGNLVASGEVTAYSDKRLKTNIKELEVRGELNPVSFEKDGKKSIGFIAQEVQELYPELVITDEESEEKYLSLNYAQLTAVLYAEIKQLKQRITELENNK